MRSWTVSLAGCFPLRTWLRGMRKLGNDAVTWLLASHKKNAPTEEWERLHAS